MLRLRPYREKDDFPYIKTWITDKREHALWCANLMAYPMTLEGLRKILWEDENNWGGHAYTVTEGDGTPVGFFVYSINEKEDSGFIKFVVVDKELRGKGYGTEMIELMLQYAYRITGVSSVLLNVFDVNVPAKRCYEKAGFVECNTTLDAFPYEGEVWGRCQMVRNC